LSAKAGTLWDAVRAKAHPFPPGAFCFVQEGLRYTVHRLFDEDPGDKRLEGERHVSGRDLCIGLREFAGRQYGLLARTVLDHWNIRRTEDFGRIVFLLVEAGLLRKTPEDSITDFENVFDFDEAFGRPLERC